MDTVKSWLDIYSNITTLEGYRVSQDDNEKDFYLELIKRGTCFVTTNINGKVVFSPSRFIGYKKNTWSKHLANKTKDGRVTNPEIEKITKTDPISGNSLEELKELSESNPIKKLLNLVLLQAIRDKASDLHFEPF